MNQLKNIFEKRQYELIIFFLLLLFVNSGYYLWQNISAQNGWTLGDWIVNYNDGGFKRRGLSGSFFIFIHDWTGLAIHKLVFVVQISSYFLFFLFFIYLLKAKTIDKFFTLLVVNPLTFLFYLNDHSIVGRKEVVLFVIFSFFLVYLVKGVREWGKDLLFAVVISLATLSHELVFFYTPYFVLAVFIHARITGTVFKPLREVQFIVAGLIPVLLIQFAGGPINQGQSLAILTERGIVASAVVKGMIYWPEHFNALAAINENLGMYLLYFISLFTGVALFYYFFVRVQQTMRISAKQFLLAFSGMLLFSLPIFILATDWGRWLHIHFMLLLMLAILFLPLKTAKVPALTTGVKPLSYLVFCLVGIYMFLWTMPHFDEGFTWRTSFVHLLEKLF